MPDPLSVHQRMNRGDTLTRQVKRIRSFMIEKKDPSRPMEKIVLYLPENINKIKVIEYPVIIAFMLSIQKWKWKQMVTS